MRITWPRFAVAVVILITMMLVGVGELPSVAAGALLHPTRRPLDQPPPQPCHAVEFAGDGIMLRGWTCKTNLPRAGTIVFLHGIADNRSGVAGAAERFTRRGYDVVAYDSRAHGESGGDACTYGYYEKKDLRRVLDALPAGPVAVIGTSLGAAVALQSAAEDTRIQAVVAAEVFSDLRTVARERAPFFLTDSIIFRTFLLAEQRGRFDIDSVSPAEAAKRISIPVLLIHGARDTDTPPQHSERVLANLRGRKQIIIVDGAGHNESLRDGATWRLVEHWVVDAVGVRPGFDRGSTGVRPGSGLAQTRAWTIR